MLCVAFLYPAALKIFGIGQTSMLKYPAETKGSLSSTSCRSSAGTAYYLWEKEGCYFLFSMGFRKNQRKNPSNRKQQKKRYFFNEIFAAYPVKNP